MAEGLELAAQILGSIARSLMLFPQEELLGRDFSGSMYCDDLGPLV